MIANSTESDAKQILTASPLENWRSPPDLKSIPEWSNWRGSESSTLEIDVYVRRYALIVVLARNEWMNEWMNEYCN